MSGEEELTLGLVENAFDFLQKAGEEVRDGSSRELKYCILHLDAAVELLLKARLFDEHWTLIFKDVDKASQSKLKTGDFQSVDLERSMARLREVANVVVAPPPIRRLRKYRNRARHFEITITVEQAKAVLASVLSFVLEFCHDHLTDQVKTHEGQLKQMLADVREFAEFVDERMGAIQATLKDADDLYVCPICWQEALVVEDGQPRCAFCEFETDAEELAEYMCEGGGRERCPHCGEQTCVFILQGNDDGGWKCAACGAFSADDYLRCSSCNEFFVGDGSLCNDCYKTKIGKW